MRVRAGKNVSAIGARNIFFAKNFARVAESNQFAIEENHLIEKFRHRFQIVMRRDDEVPCGSKLANRLAEQILRGLVQTGERFIEQKNVSFLRERSREKCALLLSAGKRADLPFGQIGEVHRVQCKIDSRGVRVAEMAPVADTHVTAHLDHAAHGNWKIPVDYTALWEIGDVGVGANFSVTAENDLAGFLWHEADKRFEKCGFTRPVRSEERDAMTAMQVEADVMHGRHTMIGHCQILYFQMVRRHRVGLVKASRR